MQMHPSYIRPLIQNTDVVWDNSVEVLISKLEKVQIQAAREVPGAARLAYFDSLYTETGRENLSVRRFIYIFLQNGQRTC